MSIEIKINYIFKFQWIVNYKCFDLYICVVHWYFCSCIWMMLFTLAIQSKYTESDVFILWKRLYYKFSLLLSACIVYVYPLTSISFSFFLFFFLVLCVFIFFFFFGTKWQLIILHWSRPIDYVLTFVYSYFKCRLI